MRKGLSLVEMMIAIILFGVMSMIGLQYYKNFMNTDLSAKKARVAALLDQATQLSNAYDLYKAQFGTSPANVAALYANNSMILTGEPTAITEIGAGPWNLSTATDIDDADADDSTNAGVDEDVAFTYTIDNSGIDDEQYCALINNTIDSTVSVNVTSSTTFMASDAAVTAYGKVFCYNSGLALGAVAAADGGAGGLTFVFIKEIN